MVQLFDENFGCNSCSLFYKSQLFSAILSTTKKENCMPDKATIKRESLYWISFRRVYVITFAFNMQLLVGDITLTLSAFKLPYLGILYQQAEKAMAPHSSTLAWKIPWTEEPGGLQSLGSLRVGHDWATSLSLFTFMHWRRKWQPPPVFLPGESQGRRSLVGCSLWGHTGSDTTEAT